MEKNKKGRDSKYTVCIYILWGVHDSHLRCENSDSIYKVLCKVIKSNIWCLCLNTQWKESVTEISECVNTIKTQRMHTGQRCSTAQCRQRVRLYQRPQCPLTQTAMRYSSQVLFCFLHLCVWGVLVHTRMPWHTWKLQHNFQDWFSLTTGNSSH